MSNMSRSLRRRKAVHNTNTKSAVYMMNRMGPSTEPRETPQISRTEAVRSTTDVLSSASQVRLKPLESNAVDDKASPESLEQDVMVDSVKCSREIQKDQCCQISTVDGQENVRKYCQTAVSVE